MIRYIIVDDCPQTIERVKVKIDAISKDYDLLHIASFNSSKKAFEDINENDYDLLIVDFEMPVYNGIELAQKVALNKKIIFLTSTTNNEKLVINSLDISGYLSKPFEIEEFENILKNKIIGKIITKISYNKSDLLTIADGVTKDIAFYPDKIFYISKSRKYKEGKMVKVDKASQNCVHFIGEDDELIVSNVRITITALSNKLKPYGFEKINKSTIVNLSKFKKRLNTELTLEDCKEEFTIGDQEKSGIITKIRSLLGV